MKRIWLTIILMVLLLASFIIATPAYAYIDLPDSAPTVESIDCYRNVLETGDFFILIYENTPYAETPDIDYSDAFIWRLMDTDGEAELAQALGYDYNENGYGYNVVSFYFSATDAPDWGENYYLTLSGAPSAFESPPEYAFEISASDYSALTDTNAVKTAITARILTMAADLDNKWGLDETTSLLLEVETGTVLSIYGEAFFRGAIYGVQAMAPEVFRLVINNITALSDRDWEEEYTTNLTTQHSGTYLEPALEAGESFFNVDYNLMGILITLAICAGIIFATWYLSGGNIWKGFIESASPLVICTRIGLFGMGELGLIAAVGWLYVSAKLWKIV